MLLINGVPLYPHDRPSIIREMNGDFNLSFTAYSLLDNKTRNEGFDELKEESIIEYDGYEFRIKLINARTGKKQVRAFSTFFDINDNYVEGAISNTRPAREYIAHALRGTGWTFNADAVTTQTIIPDFGNDLSLKLIKKILQEFKCEYDIQRNNHVVFKDKIGVTRDEPFRYGYNVKTIDHQVDTTNLKTVVRGFGKDDMAVIYKSPNVAIWGERHAEDIRDERFTIQSHLVNYIANKIMDEPEISITLDANVIGDLDLGDLVLLIYEPLNIELDVRVMRTHTVVDFVKGTTKERIVDLTIGNANQKKIIGNISDYEIKQAERDELTEERMKEFRVTIGEAEKEIAELVITSNEIKTTVSDNTERISYAESEIKQNADNISLSVRKDGVISAINLSPETITIQGKRINLVGAVNVLSDITGELGTITAGAINGVTISGSTLMSYTPDSRKRIIIEDGEMHSYNDLTAEHLSIGEGHVSVSSPDGTSVMTGAYMQSNQIGANSVNTNTINATGAVTVSSLAVNNVARFAGNVYFDGNRINGAVKTNGELGLFLNPANNKVYLRDGNGNDRASFLVDPA